MAKSSPSKEVAAKGPDEDANLGTVTNYLITAREMVINGKESLEAASKELSSITTTEKAMEADRTEITGPMNTALKAVNAKYKPWRLVLGNASQIIRGKVSDFMAEEQRKLQIIQAEEQAKARKIGAKQEAKADKLRKDGQSEKADVVEEQAASHVAVQQTVMKVEGLSSRKVWRGRITDMKAFCQGVVDGKNPITFVEVKQADLNRLANTYKNTQEFPGIVLEQVSDVVSR